MLDYFRIRHPNALQFLDDLVAEGIVKEINVEGWERGGYVMKSTKIPREINASTVLTPFDPIVWNRKRLKRLFNFDYKLEIYKPKI